MTTIKFRRDTSANWTSVNPIPAQGEPCYETDTGKLKIGNGSDNYAALPYVSDGGGSSGDLPIATATTLGGIKVGNNLSITEDGTLSANGGSTGTTDYTQLENKPQINSVELTGNKTLDDLGIQAKGNYLTALPDNAVTTDTTQEITGDKTFTGSITTANITCNNTLMASTIRTKANGTIKLAHPTNNASGMITLDNNYGQFSISSSLTGDNNLLGVTRGTAYARIMGNKIETKDKDGNLYYYINSKNITNCLLEVPQRIKLKLNNGTLTLKAGSQVIVPNGFEADGTTPKFDYVVIPNDVNTTNFWDDVRLVAYNPNTGLEPMPVLTCFSGTTQPSATKYALWYDTTNNLVKKTNDNGATWSTGISLPVCTAYGTNGTTVTRIDQVFNGMGYIGSTIWVDKGVKGLIPNGRNADGSLRNIEYTTEKLITIGYLGVSTLWSLYLNANGGFNGCPHSYYYAQETQPDIIGQTQIWYKPSENIYYYSDWENTSTFNASPIFNVCNVVWSDANSITSFNPKHTFKALDYNDKSNISDWGMPSNKCINLTLGASGSTYTAPANGYAYLSRSTTATGQYIALSSTIAIKIISTSKNQSLEAFIPVKRGNSFTVDYTAATLGTFRFVYAEGEV